MTTAQFRKLALSLPEAVERAHVGHPDFRVGKDGKIFATLGYPGDDFGVVMLTLDQQQELIGLHPEMFVPAKGAWGRRGSTQVSLKAARQAVVEEAMKSAWRNVAPKSLLKKEL